MQHTPLPEFDRPPEMTGQEYAYRRLRKAVMSGWLPPGASLTIRGLAQLLDLSPTPIREALRRLSSENAIEVQGNRRLKVPEMTPGRFGELVALRVAIEVHGGLRALAHVSDVVIDEMAEADARLAAARAAGDLDRASALNHAFHRRLYELPPDQAAMPLIESVWLQLGPFQRLAQRGPDGEPMRDSHAKILDALRLRDPDDLAAAITCDVQSVAELAETRLLLV